MLNKLLDKTIKDLVNFQTGINKLNKRFEDKIFVNCLIF